MLFLLIFVILFIILFFEAKFLIKNLHLFLFLLTKNQNTSVNLLTWLLMPGIVIHEVSHFIIAGLLGVKTGDFSFTPQLLENNKIKAGSLKISKTDPIRQTFIGLAPIIIGLSLIGYLSSLKIPNYYLLFTVYYFLFSISTTMYSSKKDLEAILFPIILIIFLSLVLWLGSFKISFSKDLLNTAYAVLQFINLGLIKTVLINLVILFLIKPVISAIIKVNVH